MNRQFYRLIVVFITLELQLNFAYAIHNYQIVFESEEIGAISSVAIGDLDKDGKKEIIATSKNNNKVYIFENIKDNTYKKIWDSGITITNQPLAVAIGDLDDDGKMDIIVGSKAEPYFGKIYVFENDDNNSYQEVWNSGRIIISGTISNYSILSIAVGDDLDGDGKKEIIAGSMESIYLFEKNTDNDYQLVFKKLIGYTSGIVTGDQDEDGKKEIIAGVNKNVYLLENNGADTYNEVWNSGGNIQGYLYYVIIGDQDSDNKKEIIAGAEDNKVYVFENIADNHYQKVWDSGGTITNYVSSIAIGDVDNNGQDEIIAGSFDKKIYIFENSDDNLYHKVWDSEVMPSWISSMAIGDTDNDNKKEIIAAAYNGKIYIFEHIPTIFHPLITEVYYNPVGTETELEFIEIYNPATFSINISDYKIGDEETKGQGEGMYKFPDNTIIAPKTYLLIARSSSEAFFNKFGKKVDFEINNSDPGVPNMTKYSSWATGYLNLDNDGDEVLLLDKNDIVVDVVVYGNGSYTNVIAHPTIQQGHSLERHPPDNDTDDCSYDFIDQYIPTPGGDINAIGNFIFLNNGTKTIATVTYIFDGDTIEVSYLNGHTATVRLLGINTPEINEPYGTTAKDFTNQLLHKRVTIITSNTLGEGTDTYGRILAAIIYEGELFNTKLLEEGLAVRLFKQNALVNFTLWEKKEAYARKNNIRLWVNISSKGIIINEINPNPYPEDDSKAEFIELYNTTSSSVNISNWKFISNRETIIPQNTTIPANSYIILARVGSITFRNIYPHTPKNIEIIDSKIELSNSSSPPQNLTIYLKDKDGYYQDALVYNLNWDSKGADNTGKSLERINPDIKNIGESFVNSLDDNNWQPSQWIKGSPGGLNSFTLHHIDVNTTTITMYVGDTQQVIVTGYDINEKIVPVFATWSVTGNIGTITSTGVFIATADGSGSIIAYVGSIITKVNVIVNPISALPQIILNKNVTPQGTVTPYTILTYTLTYRNIGSGTAKNVVIMDKIPDMTTYLQGSASGENMTIQYCHDGSGNTWNDSDATPVTHIKWTLNQDLAPDTQDEVRFKVKVKP